MIYSLTESSGFFSPEFLDETIMENSSLVGYNTITILPTVKKMEYSFVPDSELMTRMGKSKIFTTYPIDSAVITNRIEYKDK